MLCQGSYEHTPFWSRAYIDKILKKFSMHDSKKGCVPMNPGITLSKSQCPTSDLEVVNISRIPYASVIGSIMYAMICTRPDVSYALSMTSCYQAQPGPTIGI